MDYVVGQIRAMVNEGMSAEAALKSIEMEIITGRYHEVSMLNQATAALKEALEPDYRAEMDRLRKKG
jgi:hypothetical protein